MKPRIEFFEDEHIYLVDGVEVPSVTEILAPLHRGYSKINPSVLEYAAVRGKAVHEALELIDYGADPEITPEIIGYINAYQEWLQVYRPTMLGIEQIVYSADEGFCGTLDRLAVLNGRERAIIDIKTSQPTKEALVSVCCQTAAYMIALSETDEGSAPKRYGLFLKKDGTFRMVDCDEYEDKYGFSGAIVFMNLRAIYRSITRILATKERGK